MTRNSTSSSPPTFPAPPDYRTYRHRTCGTVTSVDGEHFQGLCNPFVGLFGVSTFCVSCGKQAPLREFVWEDTQESLADYRRRMWEILPFYAWPLTLAVRVVCLVGLPVGGFLLGRWFGGPGSLAWPVVGIVAGLVVGLVGAAMHMGVNSRDFTIYR